VPILANEQKLELIRYLGHKFEIPGSAQWILLSENASSLNGKKVVQIDTDP
jgi:orotate phosphoribosyltransferase-like protein